MSAAVVTARRLSIAEPQPVQAFLGFFGFVVGEIDVVQVHIDATSRGTLQERHLTVIT